MNYNDTILENKAFDIFKKLLYFIVLSVCIILAGCLVLVYGFHFRPYNVLTPSMSPVYNKGDMVVVKSQSGYKAGDVLKFSQSEDFPVVHRLLNIVTINGTTYYVCHGDAVSQNEWTLDRQTILNIDITGKSKEKVQEDYSQAIGDVQMVLLSQVEGKVVCSLRNWGTYFTFISSHKLLFITMVLGLWCVTSTVQNELEMKKARRLL